MECVEIISILNKSGINCFHQTPNSRVPKACWIIFSFSLTRPRHVHFKKCSSHLHVICVGVFLFFFNFSNFTHVPWENLYHTDHSYPLLTPSPLTLTLSLSHTHTHTHINNWMDVESRYLVCLHTLEFCHRLSSNGWPEKGCHPQHHLANAPSSAYELR